MRGGLHCSNDCGIVQRIGPRKNNGSEVRIARHVARPNRLPEFPVFKIPRGRRTARRTVADDEAPVGVRCRL